MKGEDRGQGFPQTSGVLQPLRLDLWKQSSIPCPLSLRMSTAKIAQMHDYMHTQTFVQNVTSPDNKKKYFSKYKNKNKTKKLQAANGEEKTSDELKS